MITNVRLTNFQCFDEEVQTFELRPLTFVFGPNGAGKSTLQRVIRFINQSIGHGPNFRFNGESIQLLSAGNVIHRRDLEDVTGKTDLAFNEHFSIELETDLTWRKSSQDGLISLESLGILPSTSNHKIQKINTRWDVNTFGKTIGLTIGFVSDRPSEEAYFETATLSLVETINSEGLTEWGFADNTKVLDFVSKIQNHQDEFSGANYGGEMFSEYEMRHPFEVDDVIELLGLFKENFTLNDLGLPSFGEHEGWSWATDLGIRSAEILNKYFLWHWIQLKESIKTVGYVPPIREIPNLVETTDESSYGNRRPNSISGWLEKITDGRFSYVEDLIELKGFGPYSRSYSRYVIDNHAGERKVRFQDVGVGLSQVIPVIQALFGVPVSLDERSSLLLLEQPELHLHPRMQGHLVDAVIEAVNTTGLWQQIILETHSEAMVLRDRKSVV